MFNLEAILTANGVGAVLMIILLISSRMPVSYTHLTLPTT